MGNYKEKLEECEVDIKDMLYRIVMKWRKILLVFIISGALFGSFSAIKSYQSVNEANIALAEQKKRGGPQEGEELVVVPQFQLINVKYIFLGGIVGGFLYAMVPSFLYIFSNKIRHEDELNDTFELHSIASYPNHRRICKKGSKIDSFICKVFWGKESRITDFEQHSLAVTDCVLSMKQKGYHSICFISTTNDEFKKVNAIVKQLSRLFDTCVLKQSIVSSAESLQSIQNYDCVVIVEKIDQSYYEDIVRELEYCDRFNVPVLGSIVIG